MQELLFWVYLVNIVLLILHEMDSTFWKELIVSLVQAWITISLFGEGS